MLKLSELIRGLSDEECKDLRLYCKKNIDKESDLFKLLDLAIKHKDVDDYFENLDKIKNKYFANSSLKTIYNNFSQLYLHAEDWIVIQYIKKKPVVKNTILQEWMVLKNINELSVRKYYSVDESFKDENGYDIQNNYNRFHSKFMHLMLCTSLKRDDREILLKEIHLDFLDFIGPTLSLLKLEYENLKRIFHFEVEESINQINLFLSVLPDFHNKSLFDNLNGALINFDFESYNKVGELVYNEEVKSNTITEKILFECLKGSILKLSKNKNNYKNIGYKDFIDYGLKKDLFFKNNPSITGFHNLVTLFAANSSFEDTEFLINKVISKIKEKWRNSCLILAEAQNYFYHHDFAKTTYNLKRTSFTEPNQKRIADIIFLMCSFAVRKNEREQYDIAFQNFLLYLKRNENKMSKSNFVSYNNLILFMKQVDKQNNYTIPLPIIYKSFCEHIAKIQG